jgi:hypothetical protein
MLYFISQFFPCVQFSRRYIVLKKAKSLVLAVSMLLLAGCAGSPARRAPIYGAAGAAIGASVSKDPRIAVPAAVILGLVGYEVGASQDAEAARNRESLAREEARRKAAEAERGVTTCNTSNSGRYDQNGNPTQTAGTYRCSGRQTVPGIQTTPR